MGWGGNIGPDMDAAIYVEARDCMLGWVDAKAMVAEDEVLDKGSRGEILPWPSAGPRVRLRPARAGIGAAIYSSVPSRALSNYPPSVPSNVHRRVRITCQCIVEDGHEF